jgi:TolB protein
LEVVCLWSDEVGTSELWYRFLNAGIPIAPSAGTDVMMNFVRTMAAGTTRVYVHQPDGLTWDGYLDGLRAGRSFVTNGPMLDFQVTGADGMVRPGGVVPAGRVDYELTVATATAVEQVEVLVNGQVVATEPGLEAAGSRVLSGRLDLPEGGWLAVRASGGRTEWPAMDSYPWAHTAPIWIGEVGSTEPEALSLAVADLLRALDVSAARLEAGYAGADIPQLRAHFARARERLLAMR